MEEKIRKAGIDIIGDVPWGTHFCQFYQTKEDLIDILVPYFKAGLENNEFCMWVTSEPLSEVEAKKATRKAVPNFDRYLKSGQMEIVPRSEWYLKDGVFNLQRVLDAWINKLSQALAQGYDGMRVTGNTAWLEKRDWRNFADYEEEVDKAIGEYQMIAICTYSLDKCGAYEVIDVARNHQFSLIKREGEWIILESSERKRAEEALRESERRYKELWDNAPVAYHTLDTKGIITSVNQTEAKMLGYTPEEMVAKSIFEFILPKQRVEARERFKLKITGQQIPKQDNRIYVKKDGSKIYVSIDDVLKHNSEGKVIGVWTTMVDITERKKAEKKLRKSQEHAQFLADVLESSSQPFAVSYPGGKLMTYNSAYCNLTGYSNEELRKINWFTDLTPPMWREVVSKAIEEMHHTGQPQCFTKEYIRKDGSRVPVEVLAHPIFDNKGNSKYYYSFFTDITERKWAEEALRESEEKYRTLFLHSGTGVLIIEEDTTISMVNKRLEEIGGYSKEEIIGKSFVDFFSKKEKQRYIGYHEARRRGKETPTSYEAKIRRNDGEIRTILVNIALIPGTKRSICSITDITERNMIEKELKDKSKKIRSYAWQMRRAYKALERTYLDMIHALVISVETRDHYTRGHSERVTQYCKEIAKKMGFKEKELQNLGLACRIHDVGKIGVSDRVLMKDDRLTITEWTEMKMHPVRGAEMLTFSEYFKPVIPIVLHHHEQWDGKGYPDGLKGKEIPLGARIMAVADAFDAMSSTRPYRDAIDIKKIVKELKENSGTQFDPQIVEIWLEIMDRYGVPVPKASTIEKKERMSPRKEKPFKSNN